MSKRVVMLVLANLGLGCGKDAAPPPVDPPLVVGTGSASGTPVATATATIASPTTSALPVGRCKTNADCANNEYCNDGVCEHRPTRGRPLVVDGIAHVAPHSAVHDLLDAAHEEHASIAAFARTIAELMALGAPTWLLRETQEALADEIRHTEVSLALVEKLTSKKHVIAALPAATAPLARSTEDFFRDVLRGGAIGETLAAAKAHEQKDATGDDELRAFYEMIVVDESRHAALAFKTLRWLMAEQPELARVFAEEQDAAPAELGPIFASLKEDRVRDRESVTAWV